MKDLISKINNFDYFFEFSDSSSVFNRGRNARNEIIAELAKLTDAEILKLKSELMVDTAILANHFDRFFTVKPSYRSRIFQTAWYFYRKGLFRSFGEALRAAWKRFKAITKMSTSEAILIYRKADGMIRRAKGTLRRDPGQSNPDVIKYWDLEKNDWRAFRIERLISINF